MGALSTGFSVQTDGLDGIGKGVANEAILEFLKEKKKRIFDLNEEYWKKMGDHPDFRISEDNKRYFIGLNLFDVLVTSEPTFVGVGKAIRDEVIAKNDRQYSAKTTADLYANDRLILYKRVVLPALQAGKIVVQSRGVSTSLVYQSMQKLAPGESPLTMEEIMTLEGNKLQLEHPPDLLIIPTIMDVNDVIKRLKNRTKDDNCEFENLEFQMKIKPLYESEKLKNIFESRGTIVKYIDAGKSIEYTKSQAVAAFIEATSKKRFLY